MMNKEKPAKGKYEFAHEHVRYEGQLMWQIFGSFLLPHTVFLAFLLPSALGRGDIVGYHLGSFCTAAVGLLLCIPWFASYRRSSDYYEFRMAQAKEAEPSGWHLLKGDAEKFAEGKPVIIEGKRYRVRWVARKLRTARSVPVVIVVFVIIYLGLFILRGPWWLN
ncbi:MAG: hypothetical protein ACETVN_00965 [Asgard group archaeon]